MSKMFLDSKQPLSTCKNEKCDDCSVKSILNCHFNIKQLLKFIAIMIPGPILSGYMIFIFNPLFLIPWIALFILYFGFIEIRVMCSHCPHYAEPNLKSLKCWANYGSPKLWKYRPGPMSFLEKLIFYFGFIVIFSYPIPFYILKSSIVSYLFLCIYTILIVSAFILLKKYYCSQCINFACPLNTVDSEKRKEFFKNNSIVKEAWEK